MVYMHITHDLEQEAEIILFHKKGVDKRAGGAESRGLPQAL